MMSSLRIAFLRDSPGRYWVNRPAAAFHDTHHLRLLLTEPAREAFGT
jgi:hypothetical protein